MTRNVQSGANRSGRGWAVMYDISGGRHETLLEVLKRDWRGIVDGFGIRDDPAYLRHGGKPVVAVWGMGFRDRGTFTLDDCLAILDFFKNDPVYGGNTVMLGVPSRWRTLDNDSVSDPRLHEVLSQADIISPWTVGRYRDPGSVEAWTGAFTVPDMQWCRERELEYMPVIFPGFSWHNLMRNKGRESALESIPRAGGEFLWKQAVEAKNAGAGMLYVAMFDEIDEGTQVFKVTNDPPEPVDRFATYDGLPSDHYLWLTGEIGRLLRGEIPAGPSLPERK